MANISNEKALELLRQIIKQEGSQLAAARKLDVSPAYLSDILNGNRSISDQVARKLGYRRVVFYEPLKWQAEPKE